MKKLAALLFCILLLTIPVWAQKARVTRKRHMPKPTTTAKIIERYLNATGGRESLLKIRSVHAKAELSMDGGLTGTTQTFYKAPNKVRHIVTVEGSQPSIIGFDGKNVWTASGGAKAKYDSTINAERFRNAIQYRGYVDFYRTFPVSRYVGIRKINGANAYAIEATAAGEKTPQTIYFDQKTGLIVRSDTIIPGSYKNKGVSILYYDSYREVDGVKTPLKFRSVQGTLVTNGAYTVMEFNIDLDDSIFELPPEK